MNLLCKIFVLINITHFTLVGSAIPQSLGDLEKTIQIGSMFPNIALNDIKYFSKKKATIKDFRGKWLILDFWTPGCGACIASFPKMNEFQLENSSSLQILLVGVPGTNKKNITSLYEKARISNNLKLPVLFEQNLFNKLGGYSVPYIAVIDPNGTLRYIVENLDSSSLKKIISGDLPVLPKQSNIASDLSEEQLFNLFDTNVIEKKNRLFSSSIIRWTDNLPVARIIYKNGCLLLSGFDLQSLYKLAFFGKENWGIWDNKFLYENTSNSIYIESKNPTFSPNSEKHPNEYYVYNISIYTNNSFFVDKDLSIFRTDTVLRERLKNDLTLTFPYDAKIKSRMVSCLKLSISQGWTKKIETTGGKSYSREPNGPRNGFVLHNQPVKILISRISALSNAPSDLVIIDSTNLNSNIDIEISSVYYKDVVSELKSKGFELTEYYKKMNVLVLTDKK